MRYHITADGPKRCVAKPGNCQYEHFTDEKEATEYYETKMEKSNDLHKGLTKVAVKKATPTQSDDLTGNLEELASTKSGYTKLEKCIDKRLEITQAMSDALAERDPYNPDSAQPVKKTVFKELKKDFNAYRDRTAQMVEQSENSPHKVHSYVEMKDTSLVGSATLVDSFEPNTREWHEGRQDTVGGSDVGALVTMDFKPEEEQTYFDRQGLKRSEDSKSRPLTDEDLAKSQRMAHGGSGPLYRGTVWEDRIRDRFAEDHPELTVINTKGQYANHPDRPWQQVNFDGVLAPEGKENKQEGILEIKTSGSSETWDNGVPLNYRGQTLYYLNATGLKYAKVRVCINDNEHRDYTLHADDEVAPGSGVKMEDYVKNRVEPWFRGLQASRKEAMRSGS